MIYTFHNKTEIIHITLSKKTIHRAILDKESGRRKMDEYEYYSTVAEAKESFRMLIAQCYVFFPE